MKLLNIKEVSKKLNVSKDKIKKMIQNDEIYFENESGQYFIDIDEVKDKIISISEDDLIGRTLIQSEYENIELAQLFVGSYSTDEIIKFAEENKIKSKTVNDEVKVSINDLEMLTINDAINSLAKKDFITINELELFVKGNIHKNVSDLKIIKKFDDNPYINDVYAFNHKSSVVKPIKYIVSNVMKTVQNKKVKHATFERVEKFNFVYREFYCDNGLVGIREYDKNDETFLTINRQTAGRTHIVIKNKEIERHLQYDGDGIIYNETIISKNASMIEYHFDNYGKKHIIEKKGRFF